MSVDDTGISGVVAGGWEEVEVNVEVKESGVRGASVQSIATEDI